MTSSKEILSIQTTLIPTQDHIELRLGTLRKTFILKPHHFKSGAEGYICSSQFKMDGKVYRVNCQLKEFDENMYYYWKRQYA